MRINTQARSDQWNAEDFESGPRTFTIANVLDGKADQHHDIELVEGEGRVWRPPVTVLRVLKEVWGSDGDVWKGKRVTLYRDPEVTFGRDRTGGIRVSHISGIDRPAKVKVKTARGVRTEFTVQPLTEQAPPTEPTADEVAACESDADLKALWNRSSKSDAFAALVSARKAELANPAPEAVDPEPTLLDGADQ